MRRGLSISIALMLACAGCGKDSDSSTTAPSSTPKTETFTGTVRVRGSAMHTFTVSTSGSVTANLSAAGPPATIPMGLGIGSPGDGVCGVVAGGSVTTAAASTAQLGGVLSPGSYCVTVFDVGNQTAAVTYTVIVVHP